MFPILQSANTTNFEEFITYWESCYDYSPKHEKGNTLYFDNIHLGVLTEVNIKELYIWKNGMTLSGKKAETVQIICDEIEWINSLKKLDAIESLSLDKFQLREGVWKIFLLHIIWPDYYPIFDQHTYRAYQYIMTGTIREMKELKDINEFYLDVYIPFIHKNLQDIMSKEERRKEISRVDRALFSFGKFLKSRYAKLLNPTLDFDFFRTLFTSAYSVDKRQYSTELIQYLRENPFKEPLVNELFKIRDSYLESQNYENRWKMGYFLMGEFNISFAQSEGSELIFALCCAIMVQFNLTPHQVGKLFKSIVAVQVV